MSPELNSKNKILSVNSLIKITGQARKRGKTIAFTNGCFDILHFGHVRYLEKAKKDDRILIIGLNSDGSINEIKGKNRPIIPQSERAGLLAALSCVDYVVIFDEPTPYNLIRKLKPDLLIKGADWKGKEVIGSDIVKAHGGKVEFIPYLDNLSTTNIIKTIIEKYKA